MKNRVFRSHMVKADTRQSAIMPVKAYLAKLMTSSIFSFPLSS